MDGMDISGNTLFIPGATSGIGLGLALRLLDLGNTVIIGGRRTELLEQIRAEHPAIHTVEIDTADAASIVRARDEVLSAHPDLDALVTMAGIMVPELLHGADHAADHLAVAERTIATNLLGPIRLIAAFEPHLASRPRATIMTVSSGLGFVPLPFTPTYSATKAAIHSFTESLRVQLAGTSIQVIELVPPAVQTPLMGQQVSPMAMPLEAYLDEVLSNLVQDPGAREILVANVVPIRHAVRDGKYDEVLGMLSGAHA
jgi:uncharacterized oxidoreductase